MLTYTECQRIYSRSRGAFGARLAGNTYLTCRPGVSGTSDTFMVCFYVTDIILIHADGTYTLCTDGRRSATTKARLNEFSSARIGARRSIWYHTFNGLAYNFFDGMRLDAHGAPLNLDPRILAARERFDLADPVERKVFHDWLLDHAPESVDALSRVGW